MGYANQAFSGILKKANIGWSAPINDINQITRTILYLDKNRNEIEEKAIQCVDLARNNTFDLTFTRRIDHLIKAYENGKLIVPKMEP